MDKINEVKKKREFSHLPETIVKRSLEIAKDDVKMARSWLRKYFGVFLTNKVIKAKGKPKEILRFHKSSQGREYSSYYSKIFKTTGNVRSIIDLGAGMNGYSYNDLKETFGDVSYVAIEAAGQIVESTNKYFEGENMKAASAVRKDLYLLDEVIEILKLQEKPRLVLLLQVVDALEGLENNYSKKLISEVVRECEFMVVSLPTETLGSKKKFSVNRKWFTDFLRDNLEVLEDYLINGERVFIVRAKR